MANPITVSLHDLEQDKIPLSTLTAAFGPDSLGILIVTDLPPTYPALRHRVLSYSSYLANLPASKLDTLEAPSAHYLTGWSRGQETLRTGHYDTLKGSYYINCAFYQDRALEGPPAAVAARYPDFAAYTAPNAWPDETTLPGFEAAAKELCALVIDTASLVARAVDRFGEASINGYAAGTVARVVRESVVTKARLLHYFPAEHADAAGDGDGDGGEDGWCATHVDHGCLTGLTAAMYVDEAAHPPFFSSADGTPTDGTNLTNDTTTDNTNSASTSTPNKPPSLPETPSPSQTAGLYILSRNATPTKISIPANALAFQTGEALERLTRGQFRAVPHYVRGLEAGHGRIARNTLAVFTQPNLDEVVDVETGLDFAGFSKEVVARNT